MFSKIGTTPFTKNGSDPAENLQHLQTALDSADAILIGAGAGLSTSAGFVYSGERFSHYFSDFSDQYGFADMYAGGFYPYETQEEYWAYWSRYIYVNRILNPPKPVYEQLFELVKEKDYFVLTTNVDHCFQKAGFAKERLFYTQGDYGLFQCSEPCQQLTYENEETIRQMVLAQGFSIQEDKTLWVEDKKLLKRTIPTDLVPRCPFCRKPLTMNLRSDDRFVEDEGWHRASRRYMDFLKSHHNQKLLLLELGVGWNTPGIIKYPFWRITQQERKALYACLNFGDAYAPEEILNKSLLFQEDIGSVLQRLRKPKV
jgi:NAD-dependent SIR2 family protein deacetylase